MKRLSMMLMLLVFSSSGFAASIAKVKKQPFNRVTVTMNRGELRGVKVGSNVTLRIANLGKELGGLVKSIKKQQVTISVDKGKKNLGFLSRGTKVKVITKKSKSSRAMASRKSTKKVKPSPFEIRYKTRGSERQRLDKVFSLDLEAGLAVAPVPTAGLTIGSYINHNTVFEFSYAQGTLNNPPEERNNAQITLTETETAEVGIFRFKNFFGNSFYTNAGVGARRKTLTAFAVESANIDFGDSPVYSQSFADAIFEFSIGNKWQISYFNVGIDWLGLMAPMSKIRLPNGGNNINDVQSTQIQGQTQFVADTVDNLRPKDGIGTTYSTKIYFGFAF